MSDTDIDDAEAHRLRGWYLDEWVTTEMVLDAVISVAFAPGAPNMHQILKTLLVATRFEAKVEVLEQLIASAPRCPAGSTSLGARLRARNDHRNRLAHDLLVPSVAGEPPHFLRWRKGALKAQPLTSESIERDVAELEAIRDGLRGVMRPIAEHTHQVEIAED